MQVKLTFKEFCDLATRELDYPKSDKPLEFVTSIHGAEQQIAELPEYVYIEIINPKDRDIFRDDKFEEIHKP